MIARLRGTVLDRGTDRVVVDVAGVGYLVHVPTGTALPPVGRTVELHTSLQVREDAMTLYGFLDADALATFELLIGASGVGPRLALAALATLTPGELVAAVAAADTAMLATVPGIGRKLAERMVLELADRLPARPEVGRSGAAADDDRLATVRAALEGFGFSASEVARVAAELAPEEDEGDAALLRRALRALDGARVAAGSGGGRAAR